MPAYRDYGERTETDALCPWPGRVLDLICSGEEEENVCGKWHCCKG